MAYTPELSMQASCTLRRIAWAMEMPMTRTMEKIFEHLPVLLDHQKICTACKDKTKCGECLFCQPTNKQM